MTKSLTEILALDTSSKEEFEKSLKKINSRLKKTAGVITDITSPTSDSISAYTIAPTLVVIQYIQDEEVDQTPTPTKEPVLLTESVE